MLTRSFLELDCDWCAAAPKAISLSIEVSLPIWLSTCLAIVCDSSRCYETKHMLHDRAGQMLGEFSELFSILSYSYQHLVYVINISYFETNAYLKHQNSPWGFGTNLWYFILLGQLYTKVDKPPFPLGCAGTFRTCNARLHRWRSIHSAFICYHATQILRLT